MCGEISAVVAIANSMDESSCSLFVRGGFRGRQWQVSDSLEWPAGRVHRALGLSHGGGADRLCDWDDSLQVDRVLSQQAFRVQAPADDPTNKDTATSSKKENQVSSSSRASDVHEVDRISQVPTRGRAFLRRLGGVMVAIPCQSHGQGMIIPGVEQYVSDQPSTKGAGMKEREQLDDEKVLMKRAEGQSKGKSKDQASHGGGAGE